MISVRSRAVSWILVLTMVFTTLFSNTAMVAATTEVPTTDQTVVTETDATEPTDEAVAADEEQTFNVALTVTGEEWGSAELVYEDEHGHEITIDYVTPEDAEEAEKAGEEIGAQVPDGTVVTLVMEPDTEAGGQIDGWEPFDDLEITEWTDAASAAEAEFTVDGEDVLVEAMFAEAPVYETGDAADDTDADADADATAGGSVTTGDNAECETAATTETSETKQTAGVATLATTEDGSESYPWIIEIKDDATNYTEQQLWDFLISKVGTPATGFEDLNVDVFFTTLNIPAANGFYYGTNTILATANTNLIKGSSNSANLENGTIYTVWKTVKKSKYGYSYGSPEKTTNGYFKPVVYYEPTITVDGLETPAVDQVTFNNANYGTTHKIYHGDSATIKVTSVEGYNVAVTVNNEIVKLNDNNEVTLTFEEPSNIAVVYSTIPPAIVNVEYDAAGGAISEVADEYPAGYDVSITAKPNEDWYVADVTVDGETIFNNNNFKDDRSYEFIIENVESNTVYDVEVVFAQRVLSLNETAEIKFNPATTNDQTESIVAQLFSNTTTNANASELTYYYEATLDVSEIQASYGDFAASIVGYLSQTEWFEIGADTTMTRNILGRDITFNYTSFGVNTTENIRVVWTGDAQYPEMSDETTVALVEGRDEATITYTKPSERVVFESNDDIIDALLDAAETNSSKEIQAELIEGTIPTTGGENATLKYSLSVEDDENYLGTSILAEIDVQAKSNLAAVTINVVGDGTITVGDLAASGALGTDSYDVVATPGKTSYVDSVKITGTNIEGEVEITGTYEGTVFNGSVDIANDNSYTITVTFEERTMSLTDAAKERAVNVKLNLYKSAVAAQPGEFREAAIKAVVGEEADTSKYIVEVGRESTFGEGVTWTEIVESEDLQTSAAVAAVLGLVFDINNEEKTGTIRVTQIADGKFPAVTTENITATVKDSRAESGLVDYDFTDAVEVINTTELEAILKDADHIGEYNKNGIDVNNLTFAFDDTTIPAWGEKGTVECTVSVEETADMQEGSCTVTIPVTLTAAKCVIVADSTVTDNGEIEGTGDVDGLSEITVTVTPNKGKYVKALTVTGSDNETVTVSDITYDAGKASIVITTNGKAGAVTYTVSAEYGDAVVAVKEATITYCEEHGKLDAEKLQQMVFNAVYNKEGSTPALDGYNNNKANLKIEYVYSDINMLKDYFAGNNDILKIIEGLESLAGGYTEQWAEVGTSPSLTIEALKGFTHLFGEHGTEKIRITYTDPNGVYGTVVSEEVILTVNDACYNNTVAIEKENGNSISSATIEAADDDVIAYKTYNDIKYYKQNTEFIVTAAPGNIDLGTGESTFVESIVLYEGDSTTGTELELTENEAGTLFGVTYKEKTTSATFTTGAKKNYRVVVNYGLVKLAKKNSESIVKFNMYNGGGEGDYAYEGVAPTAEEIIEAVIDTDNTTKDLLEDADVKVEYTSVNETGVEYKDISEINFTDEILNNGTAVIVKITVAKDGYPAVSVTETITLKDQRETPVVEYNLIPEAGIVYESGEEAIAELTKNMEQKLVNAEGKAVTDAPLVMELGAIVEDENGVKTATVSFSYVGSENYKPVTVNAGTVILNEVPDSAKVNLVVEGGEATVELMLSSKDALELTEDVVAEVVGATAYPIVVTPANVGETETKYAVKSVTVQQGETTVETEMTHNAQVATVTGFEPAAETEYTITVVLEEPKYAVKDTLEFLYGQSEFDEEVFFNAVIDGANSTPKMVLVETEDDVVEDGYYGMNKAGYTDKAGNIMYYKAADAETVNVKINIGYDIPFVGDTIEIPVQLEERWLPVGTEVAEPSLNAEDILAQFDVNDLLTHGADLLQEYLKFYGCHEFGEGGADSTEVIRINAYSDAIYSIAAEEITVKVIDSRAATSMNVPAEVEVTYGTTTEELVAMLTAGEYGVYADGVKVDATNLISLSKEVTGLDVNTYEVTIKYAGNEENRPCSATFQLVVKKAPVKISINSGMFRYGESPNAEELVVTDVNDDVEMITFALGLDGAMLGEEDQDNYGVAGSLTLNLPAELGKYFTAEITWGEFKTTINEFTKVISGPLSEVGISEESISTVVETLEKLNIPDNTLVRINKDTPTNIGMYVVGAVSADKNYEVAANVGYMVIHPNGMKTELAWNVEEENGIITMPHIQNGEYDLGATVVEAYEGDKESAQEYVKYLYLGVDVNGEVVAYRTNDAQSLEQYGAYTQVAYIEDFGNTMYYAEPLARAFVIVPELATVTFEGDNADRQFTYNATAQGMTATAVDMAGVELDSNNITYRYIGIDSDDFLGEDYSFKAYNSNVPPTNVGAYTVIATYADEEAGIYGMATGAMAITPADVTVAVENRTVKYGSTFNDGVTVTTNLDDECDYITMVAGVDAGGNFATEGINAVDSVANIDFPERIDNVLRPILGDAYENGVSLNEVIQATGKVTAAMEKAGFDAESIDVVIDFLNNLPQTTLGNDKITFFDWNDEGAPANVGMYIVGAVTCDPNYKLAADYGYLAVTPVGIKVELAFNTYDDNGFITKSVLAAGVFDMGAHVVATEGVDADDANQYVQNLYIGVGEDSGLVMSNKPVAELGVFDQVAYMADGTLNEVYYAEPITRTYVVVPELVDVQFENNDDLRTEIYNGKGHEFSATATDMNGEQLEGVEIRYIGYDANNIEIYNSTEAPVNVGSYNVIATYKDTEADVYGMRAGKLVIVPARADIDVASYAGPYTDEFRFADQITAVATNEEVEDTPAYVAIVRGIEGEGYLSVEKIDFVDGVVVVDFPDRVDAQLQKVLPQLYEGEGIDIVDLSIHKAGIKKVLEGLRMDTAVVDQIMAELAAAEEAGDVTVRFAELEDVAPVNIGTYMLTAIECDPNFQPAIGVGVISIYSANPDAMIAYTQEIPENGILELDQAEEFDFTAYIYDKDNSLADAEYNVTDLFYGVDVNGMPYLSSEAPRELGSYVQVSVANDISNNVYITAAARSFEITKITTEIEVVTQDAHCGEEVEFVSATIVDREGRELKGDTPELVITITDAEGNVVETPEAVGEYNVTVTFEGNNIYKAAEATAEFVIEHDYAATVTAPTCEAEGYTTYTCVCGDSYVGDIKAAPLGHKYVGSVTTAPTCTEAGVMTFVCKNDASHTYTEVIKANGHTPSTAVKEKVVAATCTKEGSYDEVVYCAVCKAELSRITVTVGKANHSYEAVVTAPTCEAEGYTTYTCECGDSYKADKTSSLGHKWDDGITTKLPTCEKDGVVTYTCQNDGKHTYTEAIKATGHSYEAVVTAPTCEVKGYTTYTCECGDSYKADETSSLGHKWDDGITTKLPTCEKDGVVTYTCQNDASHTYTEVIKANGHTPSTAVKEKVVEATCTADGSYELAVYCSVCEKELSRETVTVPAAGKHQLGDWLYDSKAHWHECGDCEAVADKAAHKFTETVTVEPTCTKAGEKEFACECGYTYTKEIAKLGHDMITDKAVAPTCEATGLTEGSHCSRCDHKVAQTVVAALGHKYVGTVTTEPTCDKEGVKTFVCQNDAKHTYTEKIAKKDHSFEWVVVKPATETEEGLKQQICKECGAKGETETIAKLAHTHKYTAAVTAPTCEAEGYATYTCACGDSYIADKVAAKGHNYEWVVVTEPTVDADGLKQQICKDCGAKGDTEVITVSATLKDADAAFDAIEGFGEVDADNLADAKAKAEAARKAWDALTPEEQNELGLERLKALVEFELAIKEVEFKVAEEIAAIEKEFADKKADHDDIERALRITESFAKEVKAKAKKSQLTVTWEHPEINWKGEIITPDAYRLTLIQNGGKKLKTIIVDADDTTYTFKNLLRGTSYRVRVTPVGQYDGRNFFSHYSVSNWAKTSLQKATVTVKKSGANKVIKSADQNSTGFQIWISTDKKFKKGVTKITVNTNKKGLNKVVKAKNFKKGKNYIKVRAYTKVNGKTVYGAWSKTVSTVK